jgi:XTP/dITP diphosphohydrolase
MEIVFATHNNHKLSEVSKMLPKSVFIINLDDINCTEDIPETSDAIEGNALQKANFVKTNYGYDCFADDTGLEIYALKGAPGVFSARWAGEHCSYQDNVDKALHIMKGRKNRDARFKTVIALILRNETHLFEGIIEGEITERPIGDSGFGYDPIFKPKGYSQTFAEMTEEFKNKISHRAIAVNKLVMFLRKFENQ